MNQSDSHPAKITIEESKDRKSLNNVSYMSEKYMSCDAC